MLFYQQVGGKAIKVAAEGCWVGGVVWCWARRQLHEMQQPLPLC